MTRSVRTCSSEEGAVEVEGAAGGEDSCLPVVIIVLLCHGDIIISIQCYIVTILTLQVHGESSDTHGEADKQQAGPRAAHFVCGNVYLKQSQITTLQFRKCK